MENLIDGAIAPEGVKLRALNDFKTLRTDTYDSVKNAVVESFPQSFNGVRLELSDVDYDGPEIASYEEQKQALMQNRYLARKLRGNVRMVDEKTGDLLDEKMVSLMRVPMITERGSTIHGGNDYYSIMQERLLPGIYTRRQENGGLETQINPRPTTGRDMRVGFDPESQQYRLKISTSDLHLYSLLKDIGHSDDDLRKRWGDELFEANSGKYDARVFEKAFQKLVPPYLRKEKPEYSRDEKAKMIREAFDRVEVNRRVAERNMPGMFNRKAATNWTASYIGKSLGESEMVKVAMDLDFIPDIAPAGIANDLWWQVELEPSEVDYGLAGPDPVKRAKADFDPDLGEKEMREPYNALYAGVGPRLAGMPTWPESYYAPEADQMGWVSWYRKFADGLRGEDDERQISRWRRFKAREGAKFRAHPTARRGFSLRNWAIDPLKLLDQPEDRKRLAEEMLDYKQQETEKYLAKKAAFSVPEIRSIAQFLNREHGAGLDVSQPAPQLEEDLLAYIMGEGNIDSGLLQMGIDGAEKAYEDVVQMSKAAHEGSPVSQMSLAKEYSDRKQYGAKQAILYGLMKDRPEEFIVDSDEGDIVGVTHTPSGFQIHTRKVAVPQEVMLPKAPYTERGSFTHDAQEYDLGKVLTDSTINPVEEIDIEDLKWVLEEDTSWQDDPDRVARADLEAPGLYAPSKEGKTTVVDGLHRLAKAVQEGKGTLKLRRASIEEPETREAVKEAAWNEIEERWDYMLKESSVGFQQALDQSSIPSDVTFYVGGDRVEVCMGDWHEEDEAQAAEALASQHFNVVDVEYESGRPGWASEALTKSAMLEGKDRYEKLALRRGTCMACGNIVGEEQVGKQLYCDDCSETSTGEGIPQSEILKYARETPKKLQEIQDKTIRRWYRTRREARRKTEEPKSEAQAEAGNYPKGKFYMRGLEFTIENRKGSTRRGWKPDGSVLWESHMYSDYGYVKRTESERDGDHIDVFLGDALESDIVYVVDQIDQKSGKFDEHKCMVGYTSMPEAREAYLECFEKGWKCGKITPITFEQFRHWCFHGDTNKEMAKTRFLLKASKVEKTIAVDLDGTWAKTVKGPFRQEVIGKPIPKMTARIRRWLREGKKVVIFTARAADKRNIPFIQNWLDYNKLPELDITNEKTPNMVRFYDDRAEGVVKDTGERKAS